MTARGPPIPPNTPRNVALQLTLGKDVDIISLQAFLFDGVTDVLARLVHLGAVDVLVSRAQRRLDELDTVTLVQRGA